MLWCANTQGSKHFSLQTRETMKSETTLHSDFDKILRGKIFADSRKKQISRKQRFPKKYEIHDGEFINYTKTNPRKN